MVKINLEKFEELWLGKRKTVHIQGFRVNETGHRIPIDGHAGIDDFVPHQTKFYQNVIQKIKEKIN